MDKSTRVLVSEFSGKVTEAFKPRGPINHVKNFMELSSAIADIDRGIAEINVSIFDRVRVALKRSGVLKKYSFSGSAGNAYLSMMDSWLDTKIEIYGLFEGKNSPFWVDSRLQKRIKELDALTPLITGSASGDSEVLRDCQILKTAYIRLSAIIIKKDFEVNLSNAVDRLKVAADIRKIFLAAGDFMHTTPRLIVKALSLGEKAYGWLGDTYRQREMKELKIEVSAVIDLGKRHLRLVSDFDGYLLLGIPDRSSVEKAAEELIEGARKIKFSRLTQVGRVAAPRIEASVRKAVEMMHDSDARMKKEQGETVSDDLSPVPR